MNDAKNIMNSVITVVVTTLCWLIGNTIWNTIGARESLPVSMQLLYAVICIAVTAAGIVIPFLIFKDKDYGWLKTLPKGYWFSLAGTGAAIAVFFPLLANGTFILQPTELTAALDIVLKSILWYGLACGIMDALFFQGVVQRTLNRYMNPYLALLITSLLYALLITLVRYRTFTLLSFFSLFFQGMTLGAIFISSHSIWSVALGGSLAQAIFHNGLFEVTYSTIETTAPFVWKLTWSGDVFTGGRFSFPAIIGFAVVTIIALLPTYFFPAVETDGEGEIVETVKHDHKIEHVILPADHIEDENAPVYVTHTLPVDPKPVVEPKHTKIVPEEVVSDTEMHRIISEDKDKVTPPPLPTMPPLPETQEAVKEETVIDSAAERLNLEGLIEEINSAEMSANMPELPKQESEKEIISVETPVNMPDLPLPEENDPTPDLPVQAVDSTEEIPADTPVHMPELPVQEKKRLSPEDIRKAREEALNKYKSKGQ